MRHEHKQQEHRRRIEGEPEVTQGIRDDVVDQDPLVCHVGTERPGTLSTRRTTETGTMVTIETMVDDLDVEEHHQEHLLQGVQHPSSEGKGEGDHRQQRT